jgi:hypothetical protein
MARRFGDATICADGRLEDDEWPTLANQGEKRLIEPRGETLAKADFHRHAVILQIRKSLTSYERIRILNRGDDSSDTGFDDADGARAGRTSACASPARS